MSFVLAALGIVSVLYGLFIMSLGSGTWFFAFWLALGAALLLGALAVHLGWWKALPAIARHGACVSAAVMFVAFLATQACILRDFDDRAEPALDYIIVLGAQVRDDGPSPVLRYRLDAAYDYLMENGATRCIVSGGRGANEPVAEADAMADYLTGRGVDESRIIREDRSSNTKENIEFCSRLLDPASNAVGIVTNNFHVFRGTAIARKAGFSHAVGLAAASSFGVLPNNMVREGLGIIKDFAAGNL